MVHNDAHVRIQALKKELLGAPSEHRQTSQPRVQQDVEAHPMTDESQAFYSESPFQIVNT